MSERIDPETPAADQSFRQRLLRASVGPILRRQNELALRMHATLELEQSEIEGFRTDLLDWYGLHARDLPWRHFDDAYEIWISEVMLQQTRVDQARPYFERFIERFPNVETLASASLDEVLLLWEGLGYYSRARNLHRAAQRMTEEFGSQFPSSLSDALKLSGVGPYTAAAVLSMAYGLPEPAVDGNVTRVLARYLALDVSVDKAPGRGAIRTVARNLVDREDPGSFNQALMDLGATVCTPTGPRCTNCPLSTGCRALAAGRTEELPMTGKKRSVPHYDVAVGVVSNRQGEILLTRRPENALLGGLWEFPGARRRDGESLEETVRRGVADRVGLVVEPSAELLAVRHAFSHFKITMHAYECPAPKSQSVGEPAQPYRWIPKSEIETVALHRAARKIADHVLSQEG